MLPHIPIFPLVTSSEFHTRIGSEGATAGQTTMSFWKGKRILLVSPEAWGEQKVSKHHYAQVLHDLGASVYFLGPASIGAYGIRSADADLPAVVASPPLLRGLRFLPTRIRARIEARHLNRIAEICGGPFDILWNFDLYRFSSLVDRSNASIRLLHVMDLPVPAALHRPASNADAIALVSRSMEQHVPASSPRPLHVPHGAAVAHGRNEPPPSLAPGIRLGYVGNMALRYLDLRAFQTIAERHPGCTLYFIGPMGGHLGGHSSSQPKVWSALLSLPNVVWVGAVPSAAIHSWLNAMDLLLISYDSARYPQETAHPHKVLEYLQSGKAILSSHLRDYAYLDHLMLMMPPGVPISDGIDQALVSLAALNGPQIQEQRRAIARASSYETHVGAIAEQLRSIRKRP
jgi:hypothetical protein